MNSTLFDAEVGFTKVNILTNKATLTTIVHGC